MALNADIYAQNLLESSLNKTFLDTGATQLNGPTQECH